MHDKGETQPLIFYPTIPLHRPKSKWSFIVAVGLCFFFLTGSWHAFSYFSRSIDPPWSYCRGHRWISRHDFRTLDRAKGVSVLHRRQGLNSYVNHKGYVEIEGTDEKDISVLVDLKATSEVLAEGMEVSVNGNEILITTVETYSGHHGCIEVDVTVQVPSSTPFVNLSFIYSRIHISETLHADIGTLDLSTEAGSIRSDATALNTNSTNIKTTAGSIRGHYTLGESLYLTSQAGSIHIEVEVDTTIKSPKASFHTYSKEGSTRVDLLPSLKHRNQIAAMHHSEAGRVNLAYPSDWEGKVEGSTSAGSLRMRGKGLEIVESRGRIGNRYEKAVKGNHWEEKGTVDISTSAGRVVFELE